MNMRFQLALIQSLKNKHKGFALAMSLMVGAALLIVGTAVVIRGQKDVEKSFAQKNKFQADSIAEMGITKYTDFLNNNRTLLTYPSCVTLNTTTGVCSDTGATNSWYNIQSTSATIIPPSTTNTCPSSAVNTNVTTSTNDIATIWANSTISGWRDAGDGQYRLIGYSYTATDSTKPDKAPGTGRLIIESRVNGTSNDDNRVSISRIAVTFAVKVGSTPSTSPANGFPGLWAKGFDFGGTPSKAYANVWDSSGCTTTKLSMPSSKVDNIPNNPLEISTTKKSGFDVTKINNGNTDIYVTPTGTVTGQPKKVDQAFPPLPGNTSSTGNNFPTVSGSYNNCPSLSGTQLPQDTDVDTTGKSYRSKTTEEKASDDATYVYNCTGNVESGGSNVMLGRTGKETLKFYIQGYLHINANGNILPCIQSTTASGCVAKDVTSGFSTGTRSIFYVKPVSGDSFQVNANGNFGDPRDPSAIQVYVYTKDGSDNPNEASIGNSGYQHSMEMKGNGSFYGFLFAPFANLESNGTTDFAGALWIKSMKFSGSPKFWQGIFDYSRLEISPDKGTPIPQLGPANLWQQLPAN